MGEIADALRRAGRLRPPSENPNRQHHEVDRGPSAREALSEPLLDSPAQTEPPRLPAEDEIHRLEGGDDDLWQPAQTWLNDPRGLATQQYRRLAIRLAELAEPRGARSIAILSAQAGDGKTTTACNLAVALAMNDQACRVVLVDLDLHRAKVATALGIEVNNPVGWVLRGELTLAQAVMKTNVEGLSVLAAGRPAKDPQWLLANPGHGSMIAELESRFDWVILDTPPILATSDAQLIQGHAAAGLMVVKAGVSAVRAVRRAIKHLPADKLLFSCLNESRTASKTDYYDYYYNESDRLARVTSTMAESDELDVERS